jgi:hypothetical protein
MEDLQWKMMIMITMCDLANLHVQDPYLLIAQVKALSMEMIN